MQETIIPWEQTSNGLYARQKKVHPFSEKNLFPVKVTAEHKMDSVTVLSACFSDYTVVFEPHISVLIDKGSSVEFLGLYQLGFEYEGSDKESRILPNICFRYALWDKDRDFRDFHRAKNKREYIRTDKQLKVKSVFCSFDMYPETHRFVEDIVNLVQQGITLKSTSRPEHPWASVDLLVRDTIGLKLSYIPYINENATLEMWIEQWQHYFTQIDFAEGIKPESDFFISYLSSLKEYIERFPDI